MNSTRGTGYIPDWLDMRDLTYRDIETPVGYAGTSVADMRPLRGTRLEQGPCNSCVGFSITRALQLAAALDKRPDLPLASPLFLYYNARRAANRELDTNVQDVGCYPRLAMQALQTFGYCSWAAWDYQPNWVNQQPTFKAYRDAYDQRGFRWYRIDGDDRFSQAREAMQNGYPVIFGMEIDGSFARHTGAQPIADIDRNDIVGGHMMCALAFGMETLVLDNWWGPNWGDQGDGTASMTDDLFNSSHVHDVYALSVQPMGDR